MNFSISPSVKSVEGAGLGNTVLGDGIAVAIVLIYTDAVEINFLLHTLKVHGGQTGKHMLWEQV